MNKNIFKVTARGILSGALAATMDAPDFFTAQEIYNDYVLSYKAAKNNQVVVALSSKRDNTNFDIWDVVKAEIC